VEYYANYFKGMEHYICMTSPSSDKDEHYLTYNIYKKSHDMLIGKMVEIPSIIVYSKTKEGLKEKIYEALKAYFDAFPEKGKIVFEDVESEKVHI
jgi:hypothetical protein